MTAQAKKDPEAIRLLVANGVLLEAPVYEKHFRGSNWMAVIDIDPSMPGGLSRRWLPRGKGECLYVLEPLGLFDPVEFGADYTTTTGRKHQTRWYGVVMALTDGFILIEKSASGARAVVRAKEARASQRDRAVALKIERDALIEKAAKLEAEITELESEPNEGVPAPGQEPEPEPEEQGAGHGA